MSDHEQFSDAEKEAFDSGWLPKDEFKGNETNWRPAEEWLERGKDLMPIVKKQNAELRDTVGNLQGTVAQLQNQLKAQAESTDALKLADAEAKILRLKQEQKDLRTQLVEARRAGATAEEEVTLQEQLDAVSEQIRTAGVKPATTQTPQAPVQLTEAQKGFLERNKDWFGPDKEKTAFAMAAGERLRAQHPEKTMDEIYPLVEKRIKEIFGGKPVRQEPRVEGGGSGGGSGEGGAGNDGENWANLPADAKAAAMRFAPKVVGEGRKFKTNKDYQAHYAREYFNPEQAQSNAHSRGSR